LGPAESLGERLFGCKRVAAAQPLGQHGARPGTRFTFKDQQAPRQQTAVVGGVCRAFELTANDLRSRCGPTDVETE